MPSGGLLNLVRIIGASLILVGWVAWVGYRLALGGQAEAGDLFPFFYVVQWIAPNDYQRTTVFWALLAAAAIAWAVAVWRLGTPEFQQMAVIGIGALFAVCVAAWLFNLGFRRWKIIRDPVTRLFIATVVTTVSVVVSAIGTICALTATSGFFEEGHAAEGWLVALVLNIPLFGLIAVGLHLRSTRNIKHGE